jgi:hypothetical protein
VCVTVTTNLVDPWALRLRDAWTLSVRDGSTCGQLSGLSIPSAPRWPELRAWPQTSPERPSEAQQGAITVESGRARAVRCRRSSAFLLVLFPTVWAAPLQDALTVRADAAMEPPPVRCTDQRVGRLRPRRPCSAVDATSVAFALREHVGNAQANTRVPAPQRRRRRGFTGTAGGATARTRVHLSASLRAMTTHVA